ncbi:DgyrCDS1594 [Dimorphilus gyrociliatus]|uniref:DgyrCDS1594 n=1 Tax=Dimorphilus gyrociliatus TaxID=2664684 RepID=A0A7I8VAZ7_9ANNE|nr:DgyrCDS1594 [Dimorphilus gyrociliatus]
MTLNDRFSSIKTPPAATVTPRGNLQSAGNFGNARGVRQRLSAALNVSRANKRLALQMENRPAVMAALKLKKKSLKQRLGNPLKKNLLLKAKAKLLAKRGRGRGRGFRGRGVGVFRGHNRANFHPKGRGEVRGGRGFSQRGGGRPRGRGQGQRGRGSFRGRGRGRGGRGRGRGRGGAKNVTREDLDKELDQYMGSTKSALDHELDAYMSEKDKE